MGLRPLWSAAARPGLTAAIALAHGGIATAADRQASARPDNRTTALLAGSVTALATLGRLATLRRAGRAARSDAHRRRHRPAVARAGGEIRGRRNRSRRLRLQYREPPSGRRARAARARRFANLRMIEDEVSRDRAGRRRRHRRAEERRQLARAACHRRRRPRARCAAQAAGIDDRRARLSSKSRSPLCLTHSRPHRDISTEFHTAERAVHAGTTAGPALEPGLGARSDASRRHRRAR